MKSLLRKFSVYRKSEARKLNCDSRFSQRLVYFISEVFPFPKYMYIRPIAQYRFTSASEAGKWHLEDLVIDLSQRICCSSVRLLCRLEFAMDG